MKNKTLVTLLIVPFVVGLLAFVSVVVIDRTVAGDISDIKWSYQENEGFKIKKDSGYELEASAVIDENVMLAPGNELTWYIQNNSGDEVEHAKIENKDNKFYLYAIEEGETRVYCSNIRGTKSKYFNAFIYENGAIILNKAVSSSNANVDPINYYGEYDIDKTSSSLKIQKAKFKLNHQVLGEENVSQDVVVSDSSSNISYNNETGEVSILDSGNAHLTLRSNDLVYLNTTYEFKVIPDAYNIYTYSDLTKATSETSIGSLVFQSSFESIDNLYKYDKDNNVFVNELKDSTKNNVSLYGNFDFNNQTFSFGDEIKIIETTYVHDYIDQYNAAKEKTVNSTIKVGLDLKHNLYGNGYTLNLHNLAYPRNGYIDTNLKKFVPDSTKDYFLGPLPYVTIGDLDTVPVVKAFAQDNIGVYLDGDNLTINDIKIQNTNEISDMNKLNYAGTVVEVGGKNNTIKNSILSNGRTIVRAFSSDNLLIDNCILKNAGEFILHLGSNKINKSNKTKSIKIDGNNEFINKKFDDFFDDTTSESGTANSYLNSFVQSGYNYKSLTQIQAGLDNTEGMVNNDGSLNYDANITVKDTSFSNSGIFSIAFETLFNGAYLYKGLPTYVSENLSSLLSVVLPNQIGGTSYPINLNIEGDTRFYDWKNVDNIYVNNLIDENIGALLGSITSSDISIDIDDFFPMRSMVKDYANKNNMLYKVTETDGTVTNYINTSVAWYGGGLNLSTINNSTTTTLNTFSDEFKTDILEEYCKGNYLNGSYMDILSKCVLLASGFNPFKFVTNDVIYNNKEPDLYGKVPQVIDLQNRN